MQTLPRDADNYDVWCERCQRVHKHFTFTQEDEDRILDENAKKLGEAIEAMILEEVYAHIERTPL